MAIFGRFTQRAQQTIAYAQQASVALKQQYVGTEHILTGSFERTRSHHDQAASRAGHLRGVMERVRDLGEGSATVRGILELTPRSKKLLESSIIQIQALQPCLCRHGALLACPASGRGERCGLHPARSGRRYGGAFAALTKSLQSDSVNPELMPRQGQGKGRRGIGAGEILPRSDQGREKRRARSRGRRTKEMERIIQILSRRTKNNPVLVGEPGVGKAPWWKG